MLKVGSVVENYEIKYIENMTVLAHNPNPNCPTPYVVWDLDFNGKGVHNGRYFDNKWEAGAAFCGVASSREEATT